MLRMTSFTSLILESVWTSVQVDEDEVAYIWKPKQGAVSRAFATGRRILGPFRPCPWTK